VIEGEHNPRATRVALTIGLLVPALVVIGRDRIGAVFGGLLAIAAVVAASVGRGFPADRLARIATLLLVTGITIGGFVVLTPVDGARRLVGVYVTCTMLSIAVPRLFFEQTRGGHGGTVVLGLLAMMGMGRATTTATYGIAVVVFLGASVAALLASDRAVAPAWRNRRGVLLPILTVSLLGAALTGALGWTLPRAEPIVTEALTRWMHGRRGEAMAGFDEGPIDLGGLSRILSSDDVAVRVSGAPVDYLRGQVYATYVNGKWHPRATVGTRSRAGVEGTLEIGDSDVPPHGVSEIVVAPVTGRRLLVPGHAIALEGTHEDARSDVLGLVTVPPARANERQRYLVTLGPEASVAPGLAPDRSDRVIGERAVEARLREIASEWAAGARTDLERLERIESRLRQFRYTLEPPDPGDREPLIHFLEAGQAGHCEYFATALALLGRSVGVPTRLVGGYRVFERSPVDDYWIVRQRDAHAWVEAWHDGAWHRWDPTPPGALDGVQRAQMSPFAARLDQLRRLWAAGFDRLADLRAVEVAGALTGVALLLLGWIWIRRRRASIADEGDVADLFEPLIRLEALLVERGVPARPAYRTLSDYATDVTDAGHAAAAAVLRDIARLRYGGGGDPASIRAAVRALIEGQEPA
jgi:transglutaminase-like putative cysteine protease